MPYIIIFIVAASSVRNCVFTFEYIEFRTVLSAQEECVPCRRKNENLNLTFLVLFDPLLAIIGVNVVALVNRF